MAIPVTHKQVYRKNGFGGITNTALCGRIAAGDDMNVADFDRQVTRKLCLRRMPSQPAMSAVDVIKSLRAAR